MKIKRFNEENKINVEDLIYLFAELSDDNIYNSKLEASISRNIGIELGEYFRSRVYMFSDLTKDRKTEYELEGLNSVLKDFQRKKPFSVYIQIDSVDKVGDTIHILNFVKNNISQIEYFGYKLDNFSISKEKEDVIRLMYIKK